MDNKSCGAIVTASNTRDFLYQSIYPDIINNFPKAYTIPDINSLEIKDQGMISACVGCATATILEAIFNKPYSEGWNYGALRGEDEQFKGMVHSNALDYLISIGGIPKEKFDLLLEMPDMAEATKKFPELLNIAKASRLSGYLKMNMGDTSTGLKKDLQIKHALTQNNIPLFAISPDYFGESHAVCIIGWDDNKDSYLIKNSWGKSYGSNGTGYVKKKEFREVYLLLTEPIKLPFKDVKETDWFYDYIKTCFMADLIQGQTADEFKPNDNLTRAEACVLMSKLMKKIDDSVNTLSKLISLKSEYNKL